MLKTIIKLAWRNTRRHKRRSILTAGIVMFAVALLIVAMAWLNGLFGTVLEGATAMAGHVRIVDPDFAEREQLNPLYENVTGVEELSNELAAQPSVTSVEPRIVTGVTVTVGDEIGDVFAAVVGANDSYLSDRLELRQHLVEGKWLESPDDVLMGAYLAEELQAKVGDEVIMLGMTQYGSISPIKGNLAGILHSGSPFVEQHIFVPLEKTQWLTDIPDGVTELLVFTDSYQQGPALAAELRGSGKFREYQVESWLEREPWAGLMKASEAMRSVIVFMVVLLAALGIWNTIMMSVLERTDEIGVLRAMGLGRLGTVLLFVTEAAFVSLSGGVAGVLLGLGPAFLLQHHGITFGEDIANNMSADLPMATTMYADVSFDLVITAVMVSLVIAFVGSAIPSLRAASIQPVTAMRTGR